MPRQRIKPQNSTPVIRTWQQADEAVRKVGDLQCRIKSIDAVYKSNLDIIKAEHAGQVAEIRETMDRLVRGLKEFALANEGDGEFKNKRSCKLNFGTIGWRKSTKISISKKTLELIKSICKKSEIIRLVRTKETVDKTALAKLTDEELARVRARRKVTDEFYVEPLIPEAADL